jgi:MraZ protein
VFQGTSSLNLDAKGRLSMPARYLDALRTEAGGQITVTRNPDGGLNLYPRPVWEEARASLAALPSSEQWLKRFYLGSASDVELDGTGRVLISPELRELAGITRDVLLLGVGHRFELWDKAAYQAKEAAEMMENIRNSEAARMLKL